MFGIFFKIYSKRSRDICDILLMTTLNEISGVITSPFYPRHYPTNQRGSWEIRARKGKRILFTVEDMEFSFWFSGVWLEWYD